MYTLEGVNSVANFVYLSLSLFIIVINLIFMFSL